MEYFGYILIAIFLFGAEVVVGVKWCEQQNERSE